MTEMHKRLIWARKEAGYETAREAAEALGIREPTYMGHENGFRGFKANAEIYARKFKVNLEWLLTGRGSPNKRKTANKPVRVYTISSVDGVFVEPGPTGGIQVLFCTEDVDHEVALILSPAVLTVLEAKLEAARQFRAGKSDTP